MWTVDDGSGAPTPAIPWYWVLLPLLLAAATLVLTKPLVTRRFATDVDSYHASGMPKGDWLRMRAQQDAAKAQANATRSAGADIATAPFARR